MNENIKNLLNKNNDFNENIVDELKKYDIDNNNIETLKTLYNKNISLFNTINLEFINSIFFKALNVEMLLYITTISNTQNALLKLSEKKANIFLSMINKYSKNYYWPPYFAALLKNFNNPEFELLINSIDLNSISENEFKRLSCILTSKKNYLNISSINQVRDYDEILDNKIQESLNNDDIVSYKNYIFLQKFSLSLSEVKLLCQKYCNDLDKLSINNSFIETLKIIKKIVLENDINNINKLIENLNNIVLEYPNYQTLSQNIFEEEYNQKLFDATKVKGQIIDGVNVIDAGTEFYMICRADGAFTYRDDDYNLYEKWNYPRRKTYSFSCSHISNSRILMYALEAKQDFVTYGFSNLPKNSIVENALGDNATMTTREKTIDPRSYHDGRKINPTNNQDSCGQKFMTFDNMINYSSRSVYTEITLERFYKDSNGNEKRLNPSYIIYTKTSTDYCNDELYKKSLETAKEFNVPLVIIDLEKVLKSERSKLDILIKNFKTIDDIKNIIQIYSNNCVDHSKFSRKEVCNLFDSYFPEQINEKNCMQNIIEKLLKKTEIKNYPHSFYQEFFDFLIVLNIRKRIISPAYFIILKEKYKLTENYENYYSDLYGITFHEYLDVEKKSIFSDYKTWEYIYNILKEHNIDFTENIYYKNPDTIKRRLETFIKYEIDINLEVLIAEDEKTYANCMEQYKPHIQKMNSINELFEMIDPSLLNRNMKLPNGNYISFKDYIKNIVFQYLPQDGIIILSDNSPITITDFIEKYLVKECQEKYNGDFEKYFFEKTKNNFGKIKINIDYDMNVDVNSLISYINNDLLKKNITLQNGETITGEEFIRLFFPLIPKNGEIKLINNEIISVIDYIQNILLSDEIQAKYNGNISKILLNTVMINDGNIELDITHLITTLEKMKEEINSINEIETQSEFLDDDFDDEKWL